MDVEFDSDAADETAVTESEALLKDLAEQKDLHLRLAADFDNFKKRSRQESDARAVAQKESFIVELLPVIDNLERALAAGASRDSALKFPNSSPRFLATVILNFPE